MIENSCDTSTQIKPVESLYNGYRFRGKSLPFEPRKKISARCDYTGMRFTRATVIELLGNEEHGYKWWGLMCDCGTKFSARSHELARRHTQSCGCLQREAGARNGGRTRLKFGEASKNELCASYKKSARERNIEWKLSPSEFVKLVTGNCVYCGTPPNKLRKPNKGVYGGFIYSGIDRIDSNLGYVLTNCCSCCWDCNRAKGALTMDEFKKWIKRLGLYQARFERGEKP